MWQTMLNTVDPGSDGSKGHARDATGTIERAILAALRRLENRQLGAAGGHCSVRRIKPLGLESLN